MFRAASSLGTGREKKKFTPGRWQAASAGLDPGAPLLAWINALPPVDENAGFYFRTPVQLRRAAPDGHPAFIALIKTIIARLRDLKRHYGDKDTDMGDFPRSFWDRAKKIRVLPDLKPVSFNGYSFHQKTRIFLGGVEGRLVFQGDIGPFLPILGAGYHIGMGQKIVYGLGRFGTAAWDKNRGTLCKPKGGNP